MTSSYSTVKPTASLPQFGILSAKEGNECGKAQPNVVGQVAQARQTEDELDAHIRSCGELAVTEEAHGNHEGAAWWTARMTELIARRTA
jgi:hypothetical protein